jgi:hypothetical protein
MRAARSVVCGIVVALGAGCGRGEARSSTPASPPPTGAPADEPAYQRGLTGAEVGLLEPLFGDSIEYAAVQVIDDHFVPFQGDHTYMTPQGSIYAPGTLFHHDFAASSVEPWVQAVFVHEIVHVWQYQSGLDPILASLSELARVDGDYERAYPYTLRAGRDLLDYGLEQEASIVEDYWLLRTFGIAPSRLENPPRSDAERDALYAGVLREFLADPGYARAIGPDELMRRHGALAAEHADAAPATGGADAIDHAARHVCSWRFPPAE